ncbi:MAG: histidine phosphatase family protein [Pseudomonadota bacterium]
MRKDLPPFFFLRHGQTAWNHERRIQGQIDTDLNATGHMQAESMARCLAQLVSDPSEYRFVTSPLKRTKQTMSYVLKALDLPADHAAEDDLLTELNFGDWEGRHWPELNAAGVEPERNPAHYHDWRAENGESYADARQRVGEWLESLEGPHIVVAHGGISRVVRGLVFDLPPEEIVQLKVPQTRFFRIADGGLDWFDAADAEA